MSFEVDDGSMPNTAKGQATSSAASAIEFLKGFLERNFLLQEITTVRCRDVEFFCCREKNATSRLIRLVFLLQRRVGKQRDVSFTMAEPMQIFMPVEASLMHVSIHKQILENHGYDKPVLFFKEHPGIAYEMCMRLEKNLAIACAILRQSMDDMAKHTEEKIQSHKCSMEAKDCALKAKDEVIESKSATMDLMMKRLQDEHKTLVASHASVIQAKDECMQSTKEKYEVEHRGMFGGNDPRYNNHLLLASHICSRGSFSKHFRAKYAKGYSRTATSVIC